MTSMRDVVAFAEKIPHAVTHVLHGTHMLPLEFPDEILQMVHDVYDKVAHAVDADAEPATVAALAPAVEPGLATAEEPTARLERNPADDADLPWWASPPGQFT